MFPKTNMGNKSGKSGSGDKTKNQKGVIKTEITAEEKYRYEQEYHLSPQMYTKIHEDWVTYSSNGFMEKDLFKFHMKESLAHMGNGFIDRVFDSFDTDNSGKMTIDEYFDCRAIISGDSLERKLEASFRLFDKDGNGELSRDEVFQILEFVSLSIQRKELIAEHGVEAALQVPLVMGYEANQEAQKLADKIFEVADKNKNGSLNYKEFKQGHYEDPSIMGFFKQF